MNTDLLNNNFIVVKNFISSSKAEELAVLFETDAIGKNFKGDEYFPNSPVRYNYRHFLYLLCCKTEEVSTVYGGKLLPTYAYGRIYLKGDILIPHTDREACEVSVTVTLKKEVDWPIQIKKPDGVHARVELEPGDAVIYRGCVAEHSRDAYPGNKHIQVFLHYVDLNGPNMQHYFDRIGRQV